MKELRFDRGRDVCGVNSSEINAGAFEEDFTEAISVNASTPLGEMHKLTAFPRTNHIFDLVLEFIAVCRTSFAVVSTQLDSHHIKVVGKDNIWYRNILLLKARVLATGLPPT